MLHSIQAKEAYGITVKLKQDKKSDIKWKNVKMENVYSVAFDMLIFHLNVTANYI